MSSFLPPPYLIVLESVSRDNIYSLQFFFLHTRYIVSHDSHMHKSHDQTYPCRCW